MNPGDELRESFDRWFSKNINTNEKRMYNELKEFAWKAWQEAFLEGYGKGQWDAGYTHSGYYD